LPEAEWKKVRVNFKQKGGNMSILSENIRLPDMLKRELEYVPLTKYYGSVEEFIKDAIETLLIVRKDLRTEIACEMYKNGEISIGKACEIAGLDIEKMKEELYKRGIKRISNETNQELEKMIKLSYEMANK